MLVKIRGIHRVRCQLADGSRETYYYAWRGGPRMKEKPHTEAFSREYALLKEKAAEASKVILTLDHLIEHFTGLKGAHPWSAWRMSSGLLREMAAIQSTVVSINITAPKSLSSLSRWGGLLRRCVGFCRRTHNIMWGCRNVRPLISKPFQNNFGLPKSTNVYPFLIELLSVRLLIG